MVKERYQHLVDTARITGDIQNGWKLVLPYTDPYEATIIDLGAEKFFLHDAGVRLLMAHLAHFIEDKEDLQAVLTAILHKHSLDTTQQKD